MVVDAALRDGHVGPRRGVDHDMVLGTRERSKRVTPPFSEAAGASDPARSTLALSACRLCRRGTPAPARGSPFSVPKTMNRTSPVRLLREGDRCSRSARRRPLLSPTDVVRDGDGEEQCRTEDK